MSFFPFLFILMVPKLRIDVNISYCKPILNEIGFSVFETKYVNILDINSWKKSYMKNEFQKKNEKQIINEKWILKENWKKDLKNMKFDWIHPN